MKYIDLEKWDRKGLYDSFNAFFDPTLRLDVRIDVTKIVELKKAKKVDGFFIPFTYLVMRAINSFEGLRLRIDDKGVYDCEIIDPSFTVALDDGSFSFLKVKYVDDYRAFEKDCREKINKCVDDAKIGKKNQKSDRGTLDVVFISALPWTDFTALSNPLPLGNPSLCSIPRINWGAFVKESDGYKMTLSNTFSHALVDGKLVCQYLSKLKESILKADEIFG